ncbi:Copia protein, partial [Mucuna pruriens]
MWTTSLKAISNIPLLCDNIVAINLSTSPILHPYAKYIEIKHNFIGDYVQKGILDLKFISTKNKLTDIFTKLFLEDKLVHIRNLLDYGALVGGPFGLLILLSKPIFLGTFKHVMGEIVET